MRAQPRTQAQVSVFASPQQALLLNASPDLRTQLLSSPLLAPPEVSSARSTPIVGILLTSADVDSVCGMLHLREFQPLRVYAVPPVRRILAEENRIFRVLERAIPPVEWVDMPLDTWFPLTVRSSESGESVRCRAVPLGGAYPDYVSDDLRRSLPREQAILGLVFAQGSKQFFYAPALPAGSRAWKEWACSSSLCLLDGTFWDDDELISAGASSKTAREIGHVPLSGAGGLLEDFRPANGGRRVLIHINNTNPILDEDSPEHRETLRAGWEIAYDGMELEL